MYVLLHNNKMKYYYSLMNRKNIGLILYKLKYFMCDQKTDFE